MLIKYRKNKLKQYQMFMIYLIDEQSNKSKYTCDNNTTKLWILHTYIYIYILIVIY